MMSRINFNDMIIQVINWIRVWLHNNNNQILFPFFFTFYFLFFCYLISFSIFFFLSVHILQQCLSYGRKRVGEWVERTLLKLQQMNILNKKRKKKMIKLNDVDCLVTVHWWHFSNKNCWYLVHVFFSTDIFTPYFERHSIRFKNGYNCCIFFSFSFVAYFTIESRIIQFCMSFWLPI